MLGLGLLLALGGPATSTQDAARERLEALIEQTNALEHFHVEYTMAKEGEGGELQIDYLAPGSLRLRFNAPKGTMDCGIVDGFMWMHMEGVDEPTKEARIDLLGRSGDSAELLAILREEFWYSGDGPDVELVMDWPFNEDHDKHDLSLSVAHTLVRTRSHGGVLGWLRAMSKLEGSLTLEGDDLIHLSHRAEARVDASNGFLRRLAMTSADGEEWSFQLVELDLEHAPDARTFAVPDPLPGADDVSGTFEQMLLSRESLRSHALRHVRVLLEVDSRRFDAEIHDELERFLSALHEPWISEKNSSWLEETRTWTQAYADWIREALRSGSSRDDLAHGARDKRLEMVGNLERVLEGLHGRVPDESAHFEDVRHWHAIHELELEVLETRFEALVASPMLDDFDARVDEALGG